MKNHNIYIKQNLFLNLKLVEVATPRKEDVRADYWYCYYHLYRGDKAILPLYFTEYWFYDNQNKLLIIETYDCDISEGVDYKDEILRCLTVIDFENMKYAKFSKLRGGRFENFKIIEDKLIYQKHTLNVTGEYEVNLKELNWEKIDI